jgi:DNA-binding MarR family transcriptional regulator
VNAARKSAVGRSPSHGSRATWEPTARIVNDLEKEGLVAFHANPHHRRAQLVVLTDKGKQTFDTAMRLQAPWVNGLSEGLSVEDIKTTHAVMKALRNKLEGNGDVEEQA